MATRFEDSSVNTIRDIQTERVIYQINSSAETKKIAEKIRKDVESVSKTMESARYTAYEKRLAVDELKIELSDKKEKVKKIRQEAERAKSHIAQIAKKVDRLTNETSKVKTAVEKINEAVQNIDPKYIEKAQSDLVNVLIKLKYETEKAQSEFNAAKEMDEIATKKLHDAELDLSRVEVQTMDKINESNRIISNVANTIEHIVKSYDEITMVANDLLKSAIRTAFESERTDTTQQDIVHEEELETA